MGILRIRAAAISVLLVGAVLVVPSASAGTGSALTQVRAVYQRVLTAEYFGPSSAVCSNLTASGVKSYTAGGKSSCTTAFSQVQHTLRHKVKGVDDSGLTAAQWRTEVAQVMKYLEVIIKGSHASVIGGESGIPGRTTLVETSSGWKFSSYPPSISS